MASKKEKEFLNKMKTDMEEKLVSNQMFDEEASDVIKEVCDTCKVLQDEVERLRGENEDLKKKLGESDDTIYELETQIAGMKKPQSCNPKLIPNQRQYKFPPQTGPGNYYRDF